MTTDLLARVPMAELICDVRLHAGGLIRAHIYPRYAHFWRTHADLDLTESELQQIVEAVQKAKST
jgi:hypothetical protein